MAVVVAVVAAVVGGVRSGRWSVVWAVVVFVVVQRLKGGRVAVGGQRPVAPVVAVAAAAVVLEAGQWQCWRRGWPVASPWLLQWAAGWWVERRDQWWWWWFGGGRWS